MTQQRRPGVCVRLTTYALLLLAALSTADARALSSERTIPNTYFGLHIFYAGAYTAWPQVAFGSWRLHDAVGTTWDYIQPERSKWNFDKLDMYVKLAERSGVDVVLTLGITPQWASARPQEASGKGPGRAAEPRDLGDWERYVEAVVTRYRGRIKFYEVWNEPRFTELQPWRGGGFYSGSAKAMVELARVAHATVKRIDPAAMMVSPSIDGEGIGLRKLDLYLRLGGGQYADVIGFHFYLQSAVEPDGIVPLARKIRDVMERNGASGLPLWNTESGYIIRQSGQNAKAMDSQGMLSVVIDERLAAAWLAQSLLLGMEAGLQRFYWFAWDSGSMGLLGAERPRRENAAGVAFRTLIGWTAGAAFQGCDVGEQPVRVCTFANGSGRQFRIVWAAVAMKFTVPDAWGARSAVQLLQEPGQVPPTLPALDLDQTPMLVN